MTCVPGTELLMAHLAGNRLRSPSTGSLPRHCERSSPGRIKSATGMNDYIAFQIYHILLFRYSICLLFFTILIIELLVADESE